MSVKIIDLETWDRRAHFDYFRTMDYPMFDVCAPVDVTKLLAYSKSRGLPFYYTAIFAVTAAANSVENLRCRIRNGAVVLHDRVHPSFTHMDKGGSLFKYVTADLGDDMEAFVASAQDKAVRQTGLFGDAADEARDDLVYLTCLPWVSFTSVSHTIKLNRDDSIPRISWGKYSTEGDKTLMPLSLTINHALADGFHVGQYFQALDAFIGRF